MSFLRSKAEQLADHLRGCIARGELIEPLPPTRAWSQQLGVGRSTFNKALKVLRREGLIVANSNRGMRLVAPSRLRLPLRTAAPRVVRLIYYGRDFADLPKGWLWGLAEPLHAQGVRLSFEKCTEARLKTYAQARSNPQELFVLMSLPAKFQMLFSRTRHAILLMGEPAPGVRCPFVDCDETGALRHATLRLLRRGFKHITLLIPRTREPGLQRARQAFESACAEWPHHSNICGDVVGLPMELLAMIAAAERFAKSVRDRRGILVTENIPLGLIMTALMRRGMAIPQQAELVAFGLSRESLTVSPMPTYYMYSERALVQTLTNAALDYFKTGGVPRLAKRIPMEMGPGK